MPLQHYDAVDRIGFLVGVLFKEGGRVVVRGIVKLHVDNVEEFMEVLGQVDDAVEFFGRSGGGARGGVRPSGEQCRRGRRKQGRHVVGGGGGRRRDKLAKHVAKGYVRTTTQLHGHATIIFVA